MNKQMTSHDFKRVPQLYNSVRYQLPEWRVRFRALHSEEIQRSVVSAKNEAEARDIIESCGCVVIDVSSASV